MPVEHMHSTRQNYFYAEYGQTIPDSPILYWVFYQFEKMHVDNVHPVIKFTSYYWLEKTPNITVQHIFTNAEQKF